MPETHPSPSTIMRVSAISRHRSWKAAARALTLHGFRMAAEIQPADAHGDLKQPRRFTPLPFRN